MQDETKPLDGGVSAASVFESPQPLAWDDEDEYRPEPPKPVGPPYWQDGKPRIGIHTSIAREVTQALESAHNLGANALQIFSASPRMWPSTGASLVPEAVAARFRERREELRLGPLAIHDNYLINLCSPDRVLRVRSIQTFHDEVVRALALGADYLVTHPGACINGDRGRAIELVARGISHAVRGMAPALARGGTAGNGLRILLENTSGMGTSLGAKMEELAALLKHCEGLPVGVCIDTAHLFHAGYPIHTPEGLEQTLERIERTVGLRNVFMFHVNDSKTPLGSRVDRHASIGKGHIGLEPFRRILNHPLLASRAFVLETPIDKPGDDRRNVAALWRLLGIKAKQAPHAKDGFTMYSKARSRQSTANSRQPTANSRQSTANSDRKLRRRRVAKRAAVGRKRSTRKRTRSARMAAD
ncbi:MAG: deoxyribonuclease IV [Candidatus Acidiferrales bacterium]